MSSFLDTMMGFYSGWLLDEKNTDKFKIICSTVAIEILSWRYHDFLKENITPIENLPKEQKEKLWNIAMQYYKDEPNKRIMAAKAAYAIELLL